GHDRVRASVERAGGEPPHGGRVLVVPRRPEVPVVLIQAPVLARGLGRRRGIQPALTPGDADRALRPSGHRTEPFHGADDPPLREVLDRLTVRTGEVARTLRRRG